MNLVTPELLAVVLLAYLIGSIPTSLWVGKFFYNIDLREHGSYNAGATNTVRVLGVKVGLPVLLFDIFKGYAATQLSTFFSGYVEGDSFMVQLKLLLGFIAVTGHLFPIFAGFKGGKGIATLLGIFIGLYPFPAFVSIGIFLVVFIITRIVSVSSLAAITAYPFITYFVFQIHNLFFTTFAVIFVGIAGYTHRQNIKRLLKGKEKKISLR
jgi:glycerol-3-phosphate acyltransferase PlsY